MINKILFKKNIKKKYLKNITNLTDPKMYEI